MDDGFTVGGVEGGGDVCGEVEGGADWERASADGVGEGASLEQFHGDEGSALVVADFVDGADVGVVEGRGGARLAREAVEGVGALADAVGKELEGDLSAELRVEGAIDDTHAALAEAVEDVVVRDALAEHGGDYTGGQISIFDGTAGGGVESRS